VSVLLRYLLRCSRLKPGFKPSASRLHQKSHAKQARLQLVARPLLVAPFYSNFLGRLSLKRIEDDYAGLF
jgi:hypothetical protein